MSETPVHAGGCLCGAVRYEGRGEPITVCHCHCTMCRRSSGAPFVTWATFALQNFEITKGRTAMFESSRQAERQFCPVCGTQLTFWSKREPGSIDVAAATLDNAAAVVPTHHIWTENRLPWLDLGDALPAYKGFAD